MSRDIYIPLQIVLTHPEHFELQTAYNVGIEDALDALTKEEVDWDWVETCLEPVLMCRFKPRKSWRYVDITGNNGGPRSLHVSVGGVFRTWFGEWLEERNYPYEII